MATTSAERYPSEQQADQRWAVRGIGLVALWLAWTVAIAAMLLATALLGTPAGRIVAVVAMLFALAPTWLVIRTTRRRWAVLGGSVVVLLLLGIALGTIGGPSQARVNSVGANVPVATGAQLLATASIENTLCLQECTRVVHLYAVPDTGSAQAEIGTGLLAAGWEARSDGGFCREGFGVAFLDGADPDITDPPAASPGTELLSITTTECGHA